MDFWRSGIRPMCGIVTTNICHCHYDRRSVIHIDNEVALGA